MPVSYASVDELIADWRPLTDQERSRAAKALQLAGILIRRNVDMSYLDVDDEREFIAREVSIDMVKAALSVTDDQYGKSSYSTSVGGIADSATLLNPTASLVLTLAHKELFGVGVTAKPSWNFGDC